jgi:hypothetical protein
MGVICHGGFACYSALLCYTRRRAGAAHTVARQHLENGRPSASHSVADLLRGGTAGRLVKFNARPRQRDRDKHVCLSRPRCTILVHPACAKRPNAYEKPRWDVTVKMDRGGTRNVSQSYEPLLRDADRVRVLGTQLELTSL